MTSGAAPISTARCKGNSPKCVEVTIEEGCACRRAATNQTGAWRRQAYEKSEIVAKKIKMTAYICHTSWIGNRRHKDHPKVVFSVPVDITHVEACSGSTSSKSKASDHLVSSMAAKSGVAPSLYRTSFAARAGFTSVWIWDAARVAWRTSSSSASSL